MYLPYWYYPLLPAVLINAIFVGPTIRVADLNCGVLCLFYWVLCFVLHFFCFWNLYPPSAIVAFYAFLLSSLLCFAFALEICSVSTISYCGVSFLLSSSSPTLGSIAVQPNLNCHNQLVGIITIIMIAIIAIVKINMTIIIIAVVSSSSLSSFPSLGNALIPGPIGT